MRRITTPTAEQDLFGTGLDGFTDGSVPSPPPTHLNADWFNQVQEEIARAVEGNGATLVAAGGDANYFQLDDAIAEMVRVVAADATADYILEGLTFSISGVSLSTTLSPGRFVQNGRRYVATTAKLTAANALNWGPLAANRDHYFYIAFENPSASTSPPNRSTVYVARLDVANGAAAPATPAGTMLFAMLVTSGADITSATYYNRGPRLVAENGAVVALRPSVGATAADLHPVSSNLVNIGYSVADSQEGYFGNAYVQNLRIRSGVSSLFTYADNYRYTFIASVNAAGIHDETILDSEDFPDGTTAYVEVRGVMIDPSDPTDGYSFRIEAHAHIDGGAPLTWSLDGSGGAPAFQDGDGAIAASVTANFYIDGNSLLRLSLTGHGTDATRWFCEVHVMVLGN